MYNLTCRKTLCLLLLSCIAIDDLLLSALFLFGFGDIIATPAAQAVLTKRGWKKMRLRMPHTLRVMNRLE